MQVHDGPSTPKITPSCPRLCTLGLILGLMAVSNSELKVFSVYLHTLQSTMPTKMFGLHLLERCHLLKELGNPDDIHAVVMKRARRTVEHILFNITPTLFAFLGRSRIICLSEVKGYKVNQGGGYGLEIP